MIPRLQTEQELEDPYAADEAYLREVIAQASAPSPAPSPAPAAAPVASTPFDVFKQNLFTTQYFPTGASPETGADQVQAGGYGYQLGNQWVSPDDQGGYVVNTPTAQEGIYKAERFDASGNKLSEFINDARNTDLQDLAQLATFALGVGPLGGMLGGTVAGALGIPVATATSAGLTAAQLAALGTTVGSAGLGILQGQDPLDVLENAIKAGATSFLPSQVSSFIPATGTAALDAALKTATEAGVRTAVNGGDVESAVIGSLVNSGVGAATGAAGLPPELVNTAIGIAKSGGDPQKIFNAVVSAGPAIQGLQNYYSKTDTGDETARLLARYGTANPLADLGLTTTVGTEDLTTQDLADIVNPPGQAVAPETQTTTTATTATITPAERLAGAYIDKLGVKDALTNEQVAQFQIAYQQATSKLGDRPVDQLSIQDILNNAPNIIGKDEAGRWLDDQGYSYDAQGNKYRADTNIPVIEIAAGLGEQQEPSTPVDLSNVQNSANALQEWANGLQGTEGEVIRQALSTGAGLFGEQIADLGFALSNMGFADRTNFLVRFGQILEQTGQNLEIPQVTEATKNFWKALEAPGSYAEKAASGFKAIIQNPLVLTQVVKEVGQEALPLLVGGGLGKLLGWAGQGIARAGTMGGDLLLNSAESMGSTARSKFQEEIDKGTPEAEAARLANADGWKAFAITATLAGVSDAGLVKKIEGGLDKLFGKVATATGKEWGEEGLEELAISLATGDSLETAIAKSLAGSFIGSKTSGSLQAQSEFNQKVADVTQQVADALRSEGITSTDGSFRPSTFTDVASQASVGVDSTTGQDVTLGDLAGPSIRDAGITTAVDPTEVLSGTELDSQQIISDYVNEVLKGNASTTAATPTTTDSTANVVVGTDPDTGADVTLGDLGLSGSSAAAPATTTPATTTAAPTDASKNVVVGTDPNTGADVTLADLGLSGAPSTAGTTVSSDATLATDAQGDTLTAADVGAATTPATVAATDVTATTDAATATSATTNAATTAVTEAATDPSTGVETTTATDPNTGTTTTTQTDANTNTSVTTEANPNTNTTTSTATDANTNTSTTTTTDANTNVTTQTDTNPNTGVTTQTESNPNTNTSTTTITDANTGVTTQTETNNNTNTTTQTETNPNTNTTTTTETNTNTGVETNTQTDTNTGVTTQTETNPNTNTTTTTETNPNTNTTTTTETNTNTNTAVTTKTNTNTGVSTTTTVDTTTGTVINTNVDEPLPLGEDVLPPVTEEELREIVAGPPPAPTPPPPAPTPAPPAPTPAPPAPTPAPPAPTPAPPAPAVKPPVVKPPSPAPSPAAQLAQVPGMTPELAKFIQELMQTEEADLLQLTTALKAEREEKREGLRGKLKSRKA